MALKEYLVNAAAGAALLAAGSTIITNKTDIARHDERIKRVESLDGSIKTLTVELGETRQQLTRVETKMEQLDVPRR